jgi:hypothetical protein
MTRYFALAILLTSASAQAQTPTTEELWKVIQQQQAEIDALKSKDSATDQELALTREQVNATGAAVDSIARNRSTGSSWTDTTQLGGYGELQYNDLSAENSANDVNEIDLHRFVLFYNHQFNDRLRFFSELELEHTVAGEGKDGEIEIEQAFLRYDLNDNHSIQGGIFLVPVGILNETHEPNTFYGVERNSVEKIIIPTTWSEAGAGIGGFYANGISWAAAMTSGLEMTDNYQIRKGRQKGSEATANDPAYTARLKYTGIPGLELAASYQYQVDANQGANDKINEGQLVAAHMVWNRGPFNLRALWADWNFEGDGVGGIEEKGADQQSGWYIEPSYKFSPGNYDIGVYARYENLDGFATKVDDDDINVEYQLGKFDEWQVGVNYWPVPNVVLKFDYRERSHDQSLAAANFDFEGIDLGIGYSF